MIRISYNAGHRFLSEYVSLDTHFTMLSILSTIIENKLKELKSMIGLNIDKSLKAYESGNIGTVVKNTVINEDILRRFSIIVNNV